METASIISNSSLKIYEEGDYNTGEAESNESIDIVEMLK
jgi:hypothetical protein